MDADPPAIVPASPPTPPHAPSIASLPLWQRRIVALVQSGIPIRDAAEQQRVSWASIDLYTRDGGPFHDALTAAQASVAVLGVAAARDLAVAHAAGMVVDAVTTSRDTAVAQRDRLGNRRTVLEAAGVLGQGQRQLPSTTPGSTTWELYLRMTAPGPPAQSAPSEGSDG